MLERLRWRLTGLYLLVALLLVACVSAVAYWQVEGHLLRAVDHSLQQKMALGFASIEEPIPAALEPAWNTYLALQPLAAPANGDEDDSEHDSTSSPDDYRHLARTDLAAVFLIATDLQGSPLKLDGDTANIPVNSAAVQSAVADGVDWRTVQSLDGERVRLLTYRIDGRRSLALQTGRSLSEEDRLLRQLVGSLLLLGGLSVLGLGLSSWWFAGRSILPARQAWERQQSFIANASHELRAPLTLLRASTEVALRKLPAEANEPRRLLNDVLAEVDAMSRLVADLLLLSRLDSNRLPLQVEAVALTDLLAALERRVRPLVQQKGLQLQLQAGAGWVQADAERLQQVLLILLDNAFRYTPQGGVVSIQANVSGRSVQIVVRDTGSGIAAEHLPHIFDRFYRVDEARGRDSGGAGLGLAIANSLIEAQHGQIRLESKPGQGTQVTLTLPAANAQN